MSRAHRRQAPVNRRQALALALGAGALTLGAARGRAEVAAEAGAAEAVVAVASAVSLLRPAVPRRAAAALELRGEDKRVQRLGDLAAGRAVILNLWAPWCLPCRREMPSLARLARALDGAGALVLPLAFEWRGATAVRRFFTETGIEGLPVWIGDGANLMATLGLENLPTTAIIDRQGMMVQTIAGEAHWDDPATIAWAQSL